MELERKRLKRRIDAAMGRIPGDVVITGCHIVDVYTQSVYEGDILIVDGVIAATGGPFTASKVISAEGLYAAPGLIESHIHIESSYVSPEEFGRLVVPLGTTTAICDPHEIVNVAGLAGLSYMKAAARHTALDIRYMMPSCVPATPFDHSGATITADDMSHAMEDGEILGVGEFMNVPGVLRGDDSVLDELIAAHKAKRPIDGHGPGVLGREIMAYASAHIVTDHECDTVESVQEHLRNGMYVMLRNGSACHDLPNLVKTVTQKGLRRFLLCSDDLHPKTIFEKGHLNEHLRLCVQAGIDGPSAITMATLNPAECYGLTDRGAIAPGKRADIVLFEDLTSFKAKEVFISGEEVGHDGAYLKPFTREDYSAVGSSIHIGDFSEEKLVMHLKSPHVKTIDIIPGSVVTDVGTATVTLDERGDFVFDERADIAKVAVVERHHDTGCVGLGLIRGYGIRRGAIAVTIAHDSHNIIVVGTNNRDMAAAVEAIKEQSGGMVSVMEGMVMDAIALPIAGLMSDKPAQWVEAKMNVFYGRAHAELGVNEAVDVIMTLCFMSLPVIPHIKLLDTGLFDVDRFTFTSIQV